VTTAIATLQSAALLGAGAKLLIAGIRHHTWYLSLLTNFILFNQLLQLSL